LYEPFGLAVLEAALSGCALVLSDIATFREIWNDAAVFVDPRDPEDIAQALSRLTQDPSLRLQLAGAAMARARNFCGAGWAESYLRLYQDAIELKPRARRVSNERRYLLSFVAVVLEPR
jgi:glycosyltransferase involved in cell wall biosynthesis